MQTSYERQFGYPGAPAEGDPKVESRTAGVDLLFGSGYLPNSIGQAVPPASAAEAAKLEGVVMKSADTYNHLELPFPGFKKGETLACAVEGKIWVAIEDDVAENDPVFVRIKASDKFPAGIFGKAGTDKAAVTSWKFASSGFFRTIAPNKYPNASVQREPIGYALINLK